MQYTHSRRRFGLIAILLILVFSMSGCSQQNTSKPATTAGYTIADTAGDWGFPSPFLHYQRGPGYIRMSFIYDSLLWKDEKAIVPALAEKWSAVPGENAYLFVLDKRAKWHDGKPVTAEDVVFTFDYLKKHGYTWARMDAVARVEPISSAEVKIVLKGPFAPFLNNIAATVPIIPAHVWRDVPDPKRMIDKAKLIGSGPYRLLDYSKEQSSYLYEAFADYYGGKPKLPQIKFVKLPPDTAVAALRQKQVDMIQAPADLIDALKQEKFTVIVGRHDWVGKLFFNHRKPPFDRAEFRKAIASSIDRKGLVDITLRGHGLPGSLGLVPPDSNWFNPAAEQPADPKQTLALMQELGYRRAGAYWEKNGIPVEMELLVSPGGIGVPGSPQQRQGEYVKDQLEKAGFKVTIRGLDAKVIDSRIAEWNFDLAFSGHGGLGGDPEVLARMTTGAGFLSARWLSNSELVKTLTQQLAETDPGKRKSLVDKAQLLYAQDCPALPLYYPTWYYAHNNRAPIFFTHQGVANGIPQPFNKLSFVR